MRKFYFVSLLIVSLASIIFALPGISMFARIYTLGLALIFLAPLPYLLIGLWAVFPAVLVWRKPRLRFLLLAAAALCVGLTLYAPSYLADLGLARDLAARGDVAPASVSFAKPVGIDIHRRVSSDPNLYASNIETRAFYGDPPCFELCERLLTGGDVAWIRLIMTHDTFTSERAQTTALLIAGTPQDCQKVTADFAPGQHCALFAPDHGLPADLTIVLDEGLSPASADAFTAYQPIGYRFAAAHGGPDGSSRVLFQSTQLFYKRPTGQISFDFGSLTRREYGGGLQLVRAPFASAGIDLADAVETLGLTLGPVRPLWSGSPDTQRTPATAPASLAQDAAYVASLLALGPDAGDFYSNALLDVIEKWHSRLSRKSTLSAAERSIFCATVTDNHIQKLFYEKQITKSHNVACP